MMTLSSVALLALIVPTGWTAKTNPDEPIAYSRDGEALVVDGGIPDRARGWTSAPFPVRPGEWFHFIGRIATSNLEHSASLNLAYYDAAGKRVQESTAVSQWAKVMAPRRLHKVLKTPTNAVTAAVSAVLRCAGWARFDQISLDYSLADWQDETDETLVLNGGFEESDLGFGELDSWGSSAGKVKRSRDADTGSWSVQLVAGEALHYAAIDAAALAVKSNERLNLHLAVKGAVTLKLKFAPTGGVIVRKWTADGWRAFDDSLTVPAGAERATLAIVAERDSLVDSLYLGRKSYAAAKKPPTVPVLPEPAKLTKLPRSEVKDFQGVPTWHIDGQPVVDSMYTFRARPGQAAHGIRYHQRVIETGRFPIYVIGEHVNIDEEGPESLGEFLTIVDYQIRFILSSVPDARFLVWYQQYPTSGFAIDYPDELGKVEDVDQGFAKQIPGYSYGSEIWSVLCEHNVKRFFEEMSKHPYGDRIVGFMPGFGNYGENNYGHIDGKYYLSPHDFSPAMTTFFRKWLLREYAGNVQAFNAAWGRKGFNFAHAQVPTMLQRSPRLGEGFLHPVRQRQTIDYARAESFALLHRVDRQGWAAKQATDGKIFNASEIGYFYQRHYHRELMPMLTNKWIDAFGPAPGYTNRGAGDDIPAYAPVGSMKAHDKVYLFQADVRTHVERGLAMRCGETTNAAESVAVLMREMGKYLTDGQIPYHWTFGKWYNDPEIYKFEHEYERLMRFSAHFPRASKSEIALVMDPLSLSVGIQYAYGTEMATAGKFMDLNRRLEWHKLGAMHDIWLLDDLLKSDRLSQYKLVIMHGICALTDEQVRLLDERLYRDGRTVLWMYAPPVFRARGTALDYSLGNGAVAGFDFGVETGEWLRPLIEIKGREFGWSKTLNYGGLGVPGSWEKPVPFPVTGFESLYDVKPAKGVKGIGTWKLNGKLAAAKCKVGEATSVFWGSVMMEREVLASLAKSAGVHLYTSRPAVAYFGENIGCVHVLEAGPMTISLPRPAAAVIDLVTGQTLAENCAAFTVEMAYKSTVLFYFGDRAAYDAAMTQVVTELAARDERLQAEKPKYHFDAVKTNQAVRIEAGTEAAVDGAGFVRDWLFLGPFASERFTGFDIDYLGGEATAAPKAGDRVGELEWRARRFSAGRVRAISNEITLPRINHLVYYLYTTIVSPTACEAVLSVGSDDGEKTWLNGELITAMDARNRSCTPESETAVVRLKPGENSLLVKVTQGDGNNGHAIRFLEVKTKKPITSLKVRVK